MISSASCLFSTFRIIPFSVLYLYRLSLYMVNLCACFCKYIFCLCVISSGSFNSCRYCFTRSICCCSIFGNIRFLICYCFRVLILCVIFPILVLLKSFLLTIVCFLGRPSSSYDFCIFLLFLMLLYILFLLPLPSSM